MRRSNVSIATLAITGALVLVPLGSFGTDDPPVNLTSGADLLQWEPQVKVGGTLLTVSGPDGKVRRYEFGAHELPYFSTFDEGDLPDGEYTYELRLLPLLTDSERAALRQARESNAGGDLERSPVASSFPAGSERVFGYFRILNGSLVDSELQESMEQRSGREQTAGVSASADTGSRITYRDQVILDDLIVVGSACIGFDCVNGENFGFDTIRLKENNTRIKFDDTSSSGSFPFTDWQLTANDSANGGANKFSIDDITNGRTPFTIEASAPSSSLYVDDGGRIGLGTATPAVQMHQKDGNTPTLRLEQDGSSGFTAQTWDIAGNEANFFIRDVTNASSLPFRIRPGAPTSAIDIASDGDVGMGTQNPQARGLHIRRTGGAATFENLLIMQRSTGGPPGMLFQDGANDHGWQFRMTSGGNFRITDTDGAGIDDGTTEFDLQRDGDLLLSGTVNASSSRELKHAFEEIDPVSILAKVSDLWIPAWSYKHQSLAKRHLGPVAEDFHATFGIGIDDKHINPSDSAGIALVAIQGLYRLLLQKDSQIDQLRTRVEALEGLLSQEPTQMP